MNPMDPTFTSSPPSAHAASTGLFPGLFLIGRPAAGKSEVIKSLHGPDPAERASRLHIGEFYELDDFPMIWSWFEEDDILARHGRQRLHTDSEGYFLDNFEWNVLIERLDLEYRKWALENGGPIESAPPRGKTSVIEFARGKEHGGFREAFGCFTPELLARGAVLYIKVSFSESLRKNRRRFNPDKPHSILEHSLPDEKLDRRLELVIDVPGQSNAIALGAEVRRGDMVVMVNATGNIAPTNEVSVGSELSGLVDRVSVDVNDQVTRGQPLAQINTRNQLVYTLMDFLYRITEPPLRPIRRIVPHLGGIDISPVILILLLVFLQRALMYYSFML